MAKLCINIDHVATIREARKILEPDPVHAAVLAELAGASGITCHLREDRRHIQDNDVLRLRQTVKTHFNLELAITDEMLQFAEKIHPYMVMFVPENRREVTTEGGLNVAGSMDRVKAATQRMKDLGILVSHFIDPDREQIDAARECGADVIELHTGAYADAPDDDARIVELQRLEAAAMHAGLNEQKVNAGHGLNVRNVRPVAAIKNLRELHIGHSIVSQALLVGFETATRNMLAAMREGEELGSRHTPEQVLAFFSI